MDVHERFVAVLYQTFEGQGQAVTGNGLRDVFDELAAVGRRVYPVRAHLRFVVNRRPPELVFPDVWLRIEKPAAAWQCNRQVVIAVQQIAFPAKDDAVRQPHGLRVLHDRHGRSVDGVPEILNPWIRGPPAADDVRQFVFCQAHFKCAHGDQCIRAALIAQGQLCDFPLLPEMAIDAVLDDWDAEHGRRRGAVNVAIVGKDVHTPLFTGQPRQHACLDGREVRDTQHRIVGRDERRADELGQCAGYIAVHQLQAAAVFRFDQMPRRGDGLRDVMRQVLHLDQTARPSSRTIGAVELQDAADTSVGADSAVHGLVFRDAGLG